MRIITQDKKFDIPYELCVLYIEPSDKGYDGTQTWLVKACVAGASNYLLGRYETEERAKEMMEMIRLDYSGREAYYFMEVE